MTKVFIGGSRRVTRLNADVCNRLDRILEKRFPVVIGDANGADKAVQNYLHSQCYDRVEVFCMEGHCRNNLGGWTTRVVSTKGKQGFDYYATKDQLMAEEATIGFMIWDGKSFGTIANVFRLQQKGKKVVLYNTKTKSFLTLRGKADWNGLISSCTKELRERIDQYAGSTPEGQETGRQVSLL